MSVFLSFLIGLINAASIFKVLYPKKMNSMMHLLGFAFMHGCSALGVTNLLNRCGKSCRLWWTNYLRLDIKRSPFTADEQKSIVQLHGIVGSK
jgi:hypothetical protein